MSCLLLSYHVLSCRVCLISSLLGLSFWCCVVLSRSQDKRPQEDTRPHTHYNARLDKTRPGLVLCCRAVSCVMLSCVLVLPCFALCCLVLSCLVLSYVVWSCYIWPSFLLSCLALFCLDLSFPVLPCLVLLDSHAVFVRPAS
jgi:hypothetical protein